MSNYPPPDNDDSNMPMPRYHQHYNNIGSQQNNDYSNHHYQQPLHHQANNRENIGWNNDNYRPPNNNNMSDNKKFNHYSQNDMHNNYNNGPPNSQRHDNYNHHRGDGGNNNNNNNNATIIKKRAAKRRVKHDLPGPAGNWFRQKKAAVANRKQSSSAAATANSSAMKTDESKKQQSNSGNAMAKLEDNGEQSADSKLIISSSSPPPSTSPSNNHKTKRQDEQLFHDHSSDLHECNAWNLMCTTLNRIVPPANLLRHNHNHHHPNAAYTSYKSTLRTCIPDNYALIHEIHEGRYDTCHLDQHLYSSDLRVPLLVGYVASVQCHAHSDWTALLVDEMQSVAKYHGGNGSSNNAGRGVLCWIEERLVKQHANWIRPGAVWMIEGAKLALFSSLEEEEEEEDDDEHGSNNHGGSDAAMSTATVDVSPSTDNSRGGGAIDRMILVGESSMVYAWTPEEASSTFTHEEFSDLMERRCDLGLQGEELPDDEVEEKDVTICDVDCTSSKSHVKKNNDIDIDADYYDVHDVLIVEKTNVQTDEIVDVDASNEEASAALEQVLEACSAANDEPMQIESQTEDAMPISQVVEGEPKDDPQPPVKNLPNPYANKTLSQVTPHEESTTKSLDAGNVPRDDDAMNSSVLVQPKESSASPANDKGIDDNTEKKCSTLDTAQSPQLQPITNRPDQQMQVDVDDSFDDMSDEDSLDEALPLNDEGKPRSITNTSMSKGDVSFDDMLDEESLDITPLKKENSSAGKLDSSKMNTPGGDSFDDMLDDDSLDIDTPNIGKLGSKMNNTPGGDSFDDMLDEDSDDNIEAMFQIKNSHPTSDNLFSGVTVLDQDDLADLGDEDDDDF
eukprot:scaffold39129_cov155-Skeletonema_marinoi.AAC.2